MKTQYVFKFDVSSDIYPNLKFPILKTIPANKIAGISQRFDDSESCIKECVEFVNNEKLSILKDNGELELITFMEANRFLAGTAKELNQKDFEAQTKRWEDGELFKIGVFPKTDNTQLPILCSIVKQSVALSIIKVTDSLQ